MPASSSARSPAPQRQHVLNNKLPASSKGGQNPARLQLALRAARERPQAADSEDILQLQHLAGNRAISGLCQEHPSKLSGGSQVIQRMTLLEEKRVGTRTLTYVGFKETEEQPPAGIPHTDGFLYIPKTDPLTQAKYPGQRVYMRERARELTEADKFNTACEEKKKELNPNLFAAVGSEGSFEFVAQSYFSSMQTPERKLDVIKRVYQMVPVGDHQELALRPLADREKRDILNDIFADSLSSFQALTTEVGSGAAQKQVTGALDPLDLVQIAGSMKPEIVPDVAPKGEAPRAVAVGFHGTNQPMSVVTGASSEVTPSGARGWGGLQKTKDIAPKIRQYGLDQPWNPLMEKLGDEAFFRKGENWDNELLSTVSLATGPIPAIKFPFPSLATPTDNQQTTYLFATVFEKSYPTFKIQTNTFPEVSVDQVRPEDMIGMVVVTKNYSKNQIQYIGKRVGYNKPVEGMNKEQFAYYVTSFVPNPKLFTRYPSATAMEIIRQAETKIEADIGNSTWGIYDHLTISK